MSNVPSNSTGFTTPPPEAVVTEGGTSRPVRLTDTTLRDGSHAMSHQFTPAQVRADFNPKALGSTSTRTCR